jgi:hypothetical protein
VQSYARRLSSSTSILARTNIVWPSDLPHDPQHQPPILLVQARNLAGCLTNSVPVAGPAISPSTPRAVAIGASTGANARVGGATQDFFCLIGGHVGQGGPQYSLRFPPTSLSLPETLLSPLLNLIPTLLTLAQSHKRTNQCAYNGGPSAQHGDSVSVSTSWVNSAVNNIANTTNTRTAPMALTTMKKLF